MSIPEQARVDAIVAEVCEYFAISSDDLVGPRRTGAIAEARHVVCWLLRQRTHMTYDDIGAMLGGRHHTTVMHGDRRVQALIDAGNVRIVEVLHDLARAIRQPRHVECVAACVPTAGGMA